jgi:Domain of unknown function (DUF5655)
VKVKKDYMDIEFFLDHPEEVPPVSEYLQTSKNRVAHLVPVDNAKDIDQQLINRMKHSYELTSK